MAIHDVRSFITALEKEGELARVKVEVDWHLEIGAIVEKNFRERGPALFFERVKDSKMPLFVGGLHTPKRIAIALEMNPDSCEEEIAREYWKRIKTPLKPKRMKTGPCKEEILKGNDVDLFSYPAPLWNELDGGRYFGTWHSVVTKDPETGWQNVGMYRMMIHDSKTCGIMFAPFQHIGLIYQKYEELGKPMPVAICIGNDPVCPMVSCAPFGTGVDEWDMAGALRKIPLQVIKGETVDLEVPAYSEIVLEGEIPPYERMEEGPFGEHTGFYGGGKTKKTFFRVNCITQRRHPFFRGSLEGIPVVEDHQVTSINHAALALKLFEEVGIPGVRSVNFPACGDPWLSAIISLKKNYHGQSLDAAKVLMGSKIGRFVKHVFVVDEDVNPFQLEEVLYAVNTRFQAGKDLIVTKNESGSLLDPSVPFEQKGVTDKMILDATWSMTYEHQPREEWSGLTHPPMVKVSKSIKERVEKRWASYGIGRKKDKEQT
jgi:UbiD family decarboxylase